MSTPDAAREITLKEAVKLCGKSEKTLRRKIEAGTLRGRRENLEYGGFMWLIDLASLEGLYPGSAPKSLLEGAVATEPPPTRLSTTPPSAPSPLPSDPAQTAPEAPEAITIGTLPSHPGQEQFFEYLLEENRDLKCELKDRDARIAGLQEKTARLERQLGEQEGTASTQSRVLEWFQRQEFRPALPPAGGTVGSSSGESRAEAADRPSIQTMVVALLAAMGTTLALLMLAGQITFVG